MISDVLLVYSRKVVWLLRTNLQTSLPIHGTKNIASPARDPDISSCTYSFPVDIFQPGHSPPRTIPPPCYMVKDISPFHHHHHLPIYNIKRSTVNVYKTDSGRSVRVRNTGQCYLSKNFRPSGSVRVRVRTRILRRGSVRTRSMG